MLSLSLVRKGTGLFTTVGANFLGTYTRGALINFARSACVTSSGGAPRQQYTTYSDMP